MINDFSIMEYLKAKNIANSIIIKAYGEKYPIVNTGNEISEKKNRRAEIVINWILNDT